MNVQNVLTQALHLFKDDVFLALTSTQNAHLVTLQDVKNVMTIKDGLWERTIVK